MARLSIFKKTTGYNLFYKFKSIPIWRRNTCASTPPSNTWFALVTHRSYTQSRCPRFPSGQFLRRFSTPCLSCYVYFQDNSDRFYLFLHLSYCIQLCCIFAKKKKNYCSFIWTYLKSIRLFNRRSWKKKSDNYNWWRSKRVKPIIKIFQFKFKNFRSK